MLVETMNRLAHPTIPIRRTAFKGEECISQNKLLRASFETVGAIISTQGSCKPSLLSTRPVETQGQLGIGSYSSTICTIRLVGNTFPRRNGMYENRMAIWNLVLAAARWLRRLATACDNHLWQSGRKIKHQAHVDDSFVQGGSTSTAGRRVFRNTDGSCISSASSCES